METNASKETKAILSIIEQLQSAEAELDKLRNRVADLDIENTKLRVEVQSLTDLLRHK